MSLRLFKEEERERFDQLLETEHYLQSARIGGRHLRYVAEVDGVWVAILDIQRRGPAFEATGKMCGVESVAAGSASGIRYQQQPVFAPRRAGAPSQPGIEILGLARMALS